MTHYDFITICMTNIPCSYEKAESMWYENTKFSDILPNIVNPVIQMGEDKKGRRYLVIHEKGYKLISTSFNID